MSCTSSFGSRLSSTSATTSPSSYFTSLVFTSPFLTTLIHYNSIPLPFTLTPFLLSYPLISILLFIHVLVHSFSPLPTFVYFCARIHILFLPPLLNLIFCLFVRWEKATKVDINKVVAELLTGRYAVTGVSSLWPFQE